MSSFTLLPQHIAAGELAEEYKQSRDIAPFNQYISEQRVIKPKFVFPFLQKLSGISQPVEIIIERGLLPADVIFTYALFAGNEYYAQSLAHTGARITSAIDRSIIGQIPESIWAKRHILHPNDHLIAQCCRVNGSPADFDEIEQFPAEYSLMDTILALNEGNPKYFDILGTLGKKYMNEYFTSVKFWKYEFACEYFEKNESVQRMAILCAKGNRVDKLMKYFPDIYTSKMLVGMLNSGKEKGQEYRGIILDLLLQYYFSEVTYCEIDPECGHEHFLCHNLIIDAATSDRPEVFDPLIPADKKREYIQTVIDNINANTTDNTRTYLLNANDCEITREECKGEDTKSLMEMRDE